MSCPPSPIISLNKSPLDFCKHVLIEFGKHSTLWWFLWAFDYCWICVLPCPLSVSDSTKCKHMWGFGLMQAMTIDVKCTRIANCWSWTYEILILICWELLLVSSIWLESSIWFIAWGQASLSMGYFDVHVFSMFCILVLCHFALHLG